MDSIRKRSVFGILSGVGVGVVATIPAVLMALVSSGGGHGDYIIARVIFPYTFLIAAQGSITYLGLAVALLQFPLYGAFLGAILNRRRRRAMSVAIGLWHVAAAVVCLSVPSSFSQVN